MMRVLSNNVIYHDGRHNAFTSMVRWRNRYWLAFRNGGNHRSRDGRIMLMHSDDLRAWSSPSVVIDSNMDDRDPTVYVCQDRLFVASMSLDREWRDKNDPLGDIAVHRKTNTFACCTADGHAWTRPQQIMMDQHALWWTVSADSAIYGAVQIRPPCRHAVTCHAELWKTTDGLNWEKVSVISDRHCATEAALAFLPDQRLVAFVRHDADAPNDKPEIIVARPPYRAWEQIVAFDFQHNGPCIGWGAGELVTISRAFFDDPNTPVVDNTCRQRLRGLILGTIDAATLQWRPTLIIPHHRGLRPKDAPDAQEDAKMNFPDIAYASIVDGHERTFAFSYYEGYKGSPSDMRLATLTHTTRS